MHCTNCGQPLEEGAAFCKNCGAAVPQSPWAPTQVVPKAGAGDQGSVPPPPPPPQTPPSQPPPDTYAQTPPPYAYPSAPPAPPMPPVQRKRTGLIIGIVAAVLVALAGIGVGVYFALRDDDSDKTTSSTTTKTGSSDADAVFVQEEGEIFLEPAGSAGPESFTGELFVPTGPTTTLNIPGTTLPSRVTTTLPKGTGTSPTTTAAGGAQVAQVVSQSGDTPALYGGSKDKQLVDKEGQLRFFEQNPEKAAAFCAALNADPTFKWSGGTQIEPSQLRAYFDELTPLMLTRDTRVTNHGYRDGRPTPRQSVLQKGQMVLVDRYGVPRVRCECGNPLAAPKPVKKTPVYTGPRWPDFDPTLIVVVQPAPVIINIFVVIDIFTGDPFERPFGTEGTDDVAPQVGVWQLEVELSMVDEDGHVFKVDWTGVVRLDPETDELSGEGTGGWSVEGPYFSGSTVVGQMTGYGSLQVGLDGQLGPGQFGEVLSIFPVMTALAIGGQSWDGDDPAEARTEFEDVIEDIIASSFPNLMTMEPTSDGPVFTELAVDDWTGSAILTPYEP